ncbi:nitrate transporter, putative [Ricinus communis]|uniref:Nitrate transporter, putative n=1 Tax=Ricinus communis TaxID=3988 RepID=B9RUM0_RICCO|nr:nitrate transporter, putative [Ricinus communis]
MFLSCALFFLGTKIYVIVKPEGSALVSVIQVLVAALKKQKLKNPENPAVSLYNYTPKGSINSKLPYTNQFRWVDKSAIALQSDRKLGKSGFQLPAASIIVISMLTLTIFIPIYDRITVPFLRKITGKEGGITILQRMGIGIIFSIITMIISGLIEERRRHLALRGSTIGLSPKGGAISSLSALWLIPQLAFAGLTEALNSVGQTEFYYKQFPENMRSIAGSFFYLGLAVVHSVTAGSNGRNWLAEDLNKGRLDLFYYMIAVLGVLNLGYFLVFAKWYRYKGKSTNTTEVMAGNDEI